MSIYLDTQREIMEKYTPISLELKTEGPCNFFLFTSLLLELAIVYFYNKKNIF